MNLIPYDKMTIKEVKLEILKPDDREQFITDNQEAFKYGATQEFGMRDNHFEEGEEIISRKTIEDSIDGKSAEAYRIIYKKKKVGGVVISIDNVNKIGHLELLFVSPKEHSRGIGYKTWQAIEQMHPEIKIWETVTPYFETRNIHFYVNRCGFHIIEFYNSHHPDPNEKEESYQEVDHDGMFRFQKIIETN